MRHAVYLAQVRHGNGLAADGVVGDAGEDQRYVFGADALDELFELLDVHVALEGVLLISAALGYLIEQRLVVEVAWDGTHLLDVALGGVEVAVGGDGEHLARVPGREDVAHDLHEHRLRRAALLDDEGVGPLHLRGAAVEEAALVLAEVELVHQLLDVAAVGAHEVDGLLPVLLAAALEDVAEGVEKDVVTGVAAIGLIAKEEGGPLVVGHCCCAGVGQHVHSQHPGGECKLVVVRGLKGALALLHGDRGQVADRKGTVARGGYVQRILFH